MTQYWPSKVAKPDGLVKRQTTKDSLATFHAVIVPNLRVPKKPKHERLKSKA